MVRVANQLVLIFRGWIRNLCRHLNKWHAIMPSGYGINTAHFRGHKNLTSRVRTPQAKSHEVPPFHNRWVIYGIESTFFVAYILFIVALDLTRRLVRILRDYASSMHMTGDAFGRGQDSSSSQRPKINNTCLIVRCDVSELVTDDSRRLD